MAIDKATWRFPIERLRVDSAVLCLHREGEDVPWCEGGRIDGRPLALPDINHGYRKTAKQELSILFWLPRFDFQGLGALAGRTFSPSEGERSDNYGSVYAFGAHNPVDTIEAVFGQPKGDTIPLELTLRFDFDFEDRIGGTFEHRFRLVLSLEKRWEP